MRLMILSLSLLVCSFGVVFAASDRVVSEVHIGLDMMAAAGLPTHISGFNVKESGWTCVDEAKEKPAYYKKGLGAFQLLKIVNFIKFEAEEGSSSVAFHNKKVATFDRETGAIKWSSDFEALFKPVEVLVACSLLPLMLADFDDARFGFICAEAEGRSRKYFRENWGFFEVFNMPGVRAVRFKKLGEREFLKVASIAEDGRIDWLLWFIDSVPSITAESPDSRK